MLDTKQSWDDLVLRHAPDEETAYRILDNRLYTNLTARFVQSHDYIAMERLFEIHATGEYDLIVIDTPPTRNAIDFLDAPARMADFFGGRLLRWLTLPYRVGGRRGPHDQRREPALLPDGRSHPRQPVPPGHRRVLLELPVDVRRLRHARQAVERLLHDKRTTFAVVTTLEAAPLHEAERFCATLIARDFHLGALVLNKTLPDSLRDPAGAAAATAVHRRRRPARRRARRIGRGHRRLALADRDRTARVLRTVGESYRNFSVVAMREAELRAELARARRRRARPDLRRRHQRRRRSRRDQPLPVQRAQSAVSTLEGLALARTTLTGPDLVHMERLVSSWRHLADLSFADLLLLAPITGEEGHRFVVLARCGRSPGRPTTRRTSSAPSSTRWNGRCTRGAGGRPTSSAATRPRSGRRIGCGCR